MSSATVPPSASGVFALPDGRLVPSLSTDDLRTELQARGSTAAELEFSSKTELVELLQAALAKPTSSGDLGASEGKDDPEGPSETKTPTPELEGGQSPSPAVLPEELTAASPSALAALVAVLKKHPALLAAVQPSPAGAGGGSAALQDRANEHKDEVSVAASPRPSKKPRTSTHSSGNSDGKAESAESAEEEAQLRRARAMLTKGIMAQEQVWYDQPRFRKNWDADPVGQRDSRHMSLGKDGVVRLKSAEGLGGFKTKAACQQYVLVLCQAGNFWPSFQMVWYAVNRLPERIPSWTWTHSRRYMLMMACFARSNSPECPVGSIPQDYMSDRIVDGILTIENGGDKDGSPYSGRSDYGHPSNRPNSRPRSYGSPPSSGSPASSRKRSAREQSRSQRGTLRRGPPKK